MQYAYAYRTGKGKLTVHVVVENEMRQATASDWRTVEARYLKYWCGKINNPFRQPVLADAYPTEFDGGDRWGPSPAEFAPCSDCVANMVSGDPNTAVVAWLRSLEEAAAEEPELPADPAEWLASLGGAEDS